MSSLGAAVDDGTEVSWRRERCTRLSAATRPYGSTSHAHMPRSTAGVHPGLSSPVAELSTAADGYQGGAHVSVRVSLVETHNRIAALAPHAQTLR